MSVTDYEIYKAVCSRAREMGLIGSIDSLLAWDEQVLLPPAGAEFRAAQATYLAGLLHQKRTDKQYGAWLAQLAESPLAEDPHSDTGANIKHLKRQYDKKTKLSEALVKELARLAVIGQQTWVEARKQNNFPKFRPILEQIVRLKREEAQALGYEECAYDALLDDYEPEERTSNVTRVLSGLREELVPLVAAIADSGKPAPSEILRKHYPRDRQEQIGRSFAKAIGFDFQRGRLDVSAHPFCGGSGPNDCRLTTRYDEHEFNEALFGILHEAGHGIYEQGLPAEEFGLPLGDAVSLGIHESQSRMWENLVGRHRSFWQWAYPQAQALFPESLGDVAADDFYFAINDVRPTLIRVESDECTYNLHILVRFELEQALIHNELEVRDLPTAWSEKYQHYLGITPPDDATGCLQDIHWSGCSIGYFSTYSLGNLYAAQFYEAAEAAIGDLPALLAKGDFTPLREWLRENIHRHGRRYLARELVERATGKPLSHAPLMRHLKGKFGALYGVG